MRLSLSDVSNVRIQPTALRPVLEITSFALTTQPPRRFQPCQLRVGTRRYGMSPDDGQILGTAVNPGMR